MEEKKNKKEKNNKNKKGLIITVIVLAILLITSIAFLGYGYIKYTDIDQKYDELSDKYDSVNKELEKVNKNLEQTNKDLEDSKAQIENAKNYITTADGYNIYSDFGFAQVIGYKGWLYAIESFDSVSNCAQELIYNEENVKFKNNMYTIKNNSEEGMDSYIIRLNIKEEDISKVFIANYPASTDAQYSTFYIFKTGEVKYSHTGEKLVSIDAFNNYKIKDITKLYCTTGNKETCRGLQVDAVLQDGTKKVIVIDN